MLKTLLSVLSAVQFQSIEALSAQLGDSQLLIKAQLDDAEALGIALEFVENKGYRLASGLDLLEPEVVSGLLSSAAAEMVLTLDVRDVVDSTNIIALNRASPGSSGYICTAEHQTAGKGRRGKVWASPYASNLYLSAVWEFADGAGALEGLSLAVGVAVADALSRAGVNGVKLKWPNDILVDDRKLAGILLEVTGEPAGLCRVVVGIGLNVNMLAAADIDQPWIDVKEISPEAANRSQLLALILNELMPLLSSFSQRGFLSYRDRWLALDAYAGRDVAILMGKESVNGKALGVDNSGALLVQTDAGIQKFSGGEVSLRSRS